MDQAGVEPATPGILVRTAGIEPATVGFGIQRLHPEARAKIGGHDRNRTCKKPLARRSLSHSATCPCLRGQFMLRHGNQSVSIFWSTSAELNCATTLCRRLPHPRWLDVRRDGAGNRGRTGVSRMAFSRTATMPYPQLGALRETRTPHGFVRSETSSSRGESNGAGGRSRTDLISGWKPDAMPTRRHPRVPCISNQLSKSGACVRRLTWRTRLKSNQQDAVLETAPAPLPRARLNTLGWPTGFEPVYREPQSRA